MKEMLVQLGKRAKDAEAALRTISTDNIIICKIYTIPNISIIIICNTMS